MSGIKTVLTVDGDIHIGGMIPLTNKQMKLFKKNPEVRKCLEEEFKRRCYEIWQQYVFEKWGV